MEELITIIAKKRLGLTNKALKVYTSKETDLGRFNRENIENHIQNTISDIKQNGISPGEFQYFSCHPDLINITQQERDYNCDTLNLLQSRYKAPTTVFQTQFVQQNQKLILQQNLANKQQKLQLSTIKQEQIAKLKQERDTERITIIKEKNNTYKSNHAKWRENLENTIIQKTDQFERKIQQMKQNEDALRTQKVEQLQHQRSKSLERQRMNLQSNQKRLRDKNSNTQGIMQYEEEIYNKHQQDMKDLFEQMRQKSEELDQLVKNKQITKELRYNQNYDAKIADVDRRLKMFETAYQKMVIEKEEYLTEKNQTQNKQWETVYGVYEQRTKTDYSSKDQQWQTMLATNQLKYEAQKSMFMTQLEENKDVHDYKILLAQTKKQQYDSQDEYNRDIQRLMLQKRFQKVQEVIDFKNCVENKNKQLVINDNYRSAQTPNLQSTGNMRGFSTQQRPETTINRQNTSQSKKQIVLDKNDVANILQDFQQRENEIRRQISVAGIQEKVQLLRQLAAERDQITLIQQEMNKQTLQQLKLTRK